MKLKNIIFFIISLAILNLSYGLSNLYIFNIFWVDGWSYPSLLIVTNLSFGFVYLMTLHYKLNANFNLFQTLFNILELALFLCFFVLIYWTIIDSPHFSQKGLFLFFCLFILFKIIVDRAFVHYLRKRNFAESIHNTIILGDNDYAQSLISEMRLNTYLGFKVIPNQIETYQPSLVEKFVIDNHIKAIFVNTDMLNFTNGIEQEFRNISENHLVKFYSFSELYSNKLKRSSYLLIGKLPVIPLFSFPLDEEISRLFKRLFDMIFSLFVLIFVLSWLIPLVAILIKINSKGSVFYNHDRIGLDNCPFKCIKFRTMHESTKSVNSDKFQQTVKNDLRVFSLGKILRKYNIDELPQFINSLKGDISIVGPRPMMIGHIKEFDQDITEMYSRHRIKPGITGLAQVMGYRGEVENVDKMRGRVRLDRYYIQNWSFLMDVKIIWWTIRNTIFGDENAI